MTAAETWASYMWRRTVAAARNFIREETAT